MASLKQTTSENEMKSLSTRKSIATKIIKRFKAGDLKTCTVSRGFKMYSALTDKMKVDIKLADYLGHDTLTGSILRIAEFFEGMSDDEYEAWLVVNC